MKSICTFLAAASWCALETTALESKAKYFEKPGKNKPIIFAHRGSSGMFPENSEMAIRDSYAANVNFIEVDLFITKDGEVVLFHDDTLDAVTNVRSVSKFANKVGFLSRKFSTYDFTLAEMKELRLNQRYSYRDQSHNGKQQIMTLQELWDLMREMRQAMDEPYKVGIYLELKDVEAQKDATGYDLIKLVWASLQENGLSTVADCEDEIPIIIEPQNFSNTKRWQAYTKSDLPTVITVDDPNNNEELAENATVANAQAVSLKEIMEDEKVDKKKAEVVSRIQKTDSLAFGYSILEDSLLTYYTLSEADKAEDQKKKKNPFKDGIAENEITLFIKKGADGLFIEFPHFTQNFINKLEYDDIELLEESAFTFAPATALIAVTVAQALLF